MTDSSFVSVLWLFGYFSHFYVGCLFVYLFGYYEKAAKVLRLYTAPFHKFRT